MSKLFLYLFGMLISEVFPNTQSCGDSGILQSKMVESFCVSPKKSEPVGRTRVRENNCLLCLLCIVSKCRCFPIQSKFKLCYFLFWLWI